MGIRYVLLWVGTGQEALMSQAQQGSTGQISQWDHPDALSKCGGSPFSVPLFSFPIPFFPPSPQACLGFIRLLIASHLHGMTKVSTLDPLAKKAWGERKRRGLCPEYLSCVWCVWHLCLGLPPCTSVLVWGMLSLHKYINMSCSYLY